MTIPFAGQGVLLDIEGTTGSLAFVRETLFPYAQSHLSAFLERHWDTPETTAARERIARDAGTGPLDLWRATRDPGATDPAARERFAGAVAELMRADAKQTGLKELQGLIWEEGYRTGELRSHVYPDVPPALRHWAREGLEIAIYSSGSIRAQQLYFAHTEEGDLRSLIGAHFDTTTGSKRDTESYVRIARALRLPAREILFVSDSADELAAAQTAGFAVALAGRPGNPAPPPEAAPFPRLASFTEIQPTRPAASRESEPRAIFATNL